MAYNEKGLVPARLILLVHAAPLTVTIISSRTKNAMLCMLDRRSAQNKHACNRVLAKLSS